MEPAERKWMGALTTVTMARSGPARKCRKNCSGPGLSSCRLERWLRRHRSGAWRCFRHGPDLQRLLDLRQHDDGKRNQQTDAPLPQREALGVEQVLQRAELRGKDDRQDRQPAPLEELRVAQDLTAKERTVFVRGLQ